jgi:deoxycytidylate deaminase
MYNTFGVVININEYLIASGYSEGEKALEHFDPFSQIIKSLPCHYLIIDSGVKQNIYSQRYNNKFAATNWKYLEQNKPIYEHNGIMFIYRLY